MSTKKLVLLERCTRKMWEYIGVLFCSFFWFTFCGFWAVLFFLNARFVSIRFVIWFIFIKSAIFFLIFFKFAKRLLFLAENLYKIDIEKTMRIILLKISIFHNVQHQNQRIYGVCKFPKICSLHLRFRTRAKILHHRINDENHSLCNISWANFTYQPYFAIWNTLKNGHLHFMNSSLRF